MSILSDETISIAGFTLKQVLNAIDLYERKPLDKRSPKTLRNLVCSYAGKENVEDEQVKKVFKNIHPKFFTKAWISKTVIFECNHTD